MERDPRTWTERLGPLHEEFFGKGKVDPLSPVRLQVIDRASFDALQQLSGAGLVTATVRATRQLHPAPDPRPDGLTEEEKRKTADLRKRAERKLKMARVLSMEQLDEEARDALLGAVPLLGQALAIEHRLPEPQVARDALSAPLIPLWGQAHNALREFIDRPEMPVLATVEALEAADLM